MIKHIIFDFGGVILDLGGKHSGIPDDLASIFNLPYEGVAKLWNENKADLLTGKQTPIQFLTFFINAFELDHDPQRSLAEWEAINNLTKDKIDWDLVKYIDQLRQKYSVHLLTDQIDVNNGPDQWKAEISDLFHSIFRSYVEGYRKPDLDAYHNVIQKLDTTADTCVFIDDAQKNIDAANEVGMHGILYQYGNTQSLKKELSKLGISI
jgi:HAD superfamily hydrolase (TIGR01509 family)